MKKMKDDVRVLGISKSKKAQKQDWDGTIKHIVIML